jgi:hypothetical protein
MKRVLFKFPEFLKVEPFKGNPLFDIVSFILPLHYNPMGFKCGFSHILDFFHCIEMLILLCRLIQ